MYWRIRLQHRRTILKQRMNQPLLQWIDLTGHSLFLILKIQKKYLFKLEVQVATEEVVQVNAENKVAVEGNVTASK